MTTAARPSLGFVEDVWRPTAKQREAWRAVKDHRYVLYGGARGGGKSRWLRWTLLALLVRWAREGHRNVRVALFCEDYPTLRDRQLTKILTEFPAWLGALKATQDEGHGFFLSPQYGGGAILLRNLDEPAKYQSAEFAAIAVEELTKNPLTVFNLLRGSLRWAGISDTKFLAATNPGGPGHLWVKQYWIDRTYPPELLPLASQFVFVSALPSDNPYLSEGYWAELRSLPTHMRKAWLEGSWDVFEGQAFDEWSPSVHVIAWDVPRDGWRWYAGLDWGYRAPSVVALFAVNAQQQVIVRREWVYRQLTSYEVGYQLGQSLHQYPVPEWIGADSSMWAKEGAPSHAEEVQRGLAAAMGSQAPALVAAPKGPGSRVVRVDLMHEFLRWTCDPGQEPKPHQLPRLRFHVSCKYLIGSLPSLPVSRTNSEDVDTDGEDHGFDAVSYALSLRFPRTAKPTEWIPEGQHPGFIPGTYQRRNRERSEAVEQRETVQSMRAQGQLRVGRYQRPRG